jgi:hypothetical protein
MFTGPVHHRFKASMEVKDWPLALGRPLPLVELMGFCAYARKKAGLRPTTQTLFQCYIRTLAPAYLTGLNQLLLSKASSYYLYN